MKKIKTMRIASVLLIAVLLTTSIISGTFAKYVTTGSVADEARVAKFGVTITGTGSMFSKTYFNAGAVSGNTPGTMSDDPNTVLTVESDEKVVAPGTKSSEATPLKITVTGQPEVDVKITLAISGISDIYLKAGTYPDRTSQDKTDSFGQNEDYYPIVYKLTDGNGNIVAADTSLVGLNAKLSGYELYCDAGELQNVSYTLTWEWVFGDPANNAPDTLLGDLAAGVDMAGEVADAVDAGSYSLNVAMTLSVTVSQVD